MKTKWLCLGVVTALTVASANALELKSPVAGVGLKAVGGANTAAASEKEAKQAALQKAFESSIVTANKNLALANTMAQDALWTLGDVILDEEVMKDLKSRKSEAGIDGELTKALNTALKAKDFDSSELTAQNTKYVQAVTKLQISHNRYENIMNNMSPNFKKVLDGELSMLAAKTQLIESGKLTKNVKSVSTSQGAVLRKLNNINEKNSVYITIPDSEKVKYNKDGVVGSINYQLDTINANVDKAYQELITAFNLKNKVAEEKAKINNNPDLTKAEKDAALKRVVTDVTVQELANIETAMAEGTIKELNAQQSAAIINSTAIITDAIANYTALGITCTKLGMQISTKPIMAAPLALEVGQLKYTASILKEGVSSLKKVSAQTVKIAKAANLKVKTNESKAGNAIKAKF